MGLQMAVSMAAASVIKPVALAVLSVPPPRRVGGLRIAIIGCEGIATRTELMAAVATLSGDMRGIV